MSSSDKRAKPLRGLGVAVLLGLLCLPVGCQVRPLYSSSGAEAQALSSISFSPANSRVEQEVRNALIFLTSGGAGEPASPVFHVDLTVTSEVQGVLFNQSTDVSTAGRVTVKADFNLTEVATGRTVRSASRTSIALVDFPTQEFAKLRSIRDAETRASRELAEIIRADLASSLSR